MRLRNCIHMYHMVSKYNYLNHLQWVLEKLATIPRTPYYNNYLNNDVNPRRWVRIIIHEPKTTNHCTKPKSEIWKTIKLVVHKAYDIETSLIFLGLEKLGLLLARISRLN